nr:MAG TPA: hypothetical protein [Caudoviricetes sp.]
MKRNKAVKSHFKIDTSLPMPEKRHPIGQI